MRLLVLLVAILSAIAIQAQADVTGTAQVIDGDTIVIAGEHIRLQGIDAPETDQTCTAYGPQWSCGRSAADWLKDYLRGRKVECVGHARDRYGRLLAVCMHTGGEDINDGLVREGWALDYRKYSTGYLAAAEAKRQGAGVWRGGFVLPWQWRSGHR